MAEHDDSGAPVGISRYGVMDGSFITLRVAVSWTLCRCAQSAAAGLRHMTHAAHSCSRASRAQHAFLTPQHALRHCTQTQIPESVDDLPLVEEAVLSSAFQTSALVQVRA